MTLALKIMYTGSSPFNAYMAVLILLFDQTKSSNVVFFPFSLADLLEIKTISQHCWLQCVSESSSSPALTSSSMMKLKEDINPLLLQVVRSVVWVYTVITYIPSYFFSAAGSNLERARRIKARSVSGHPSGPYRAINSEGKLVLMLHHGVDTLDKMFEFAAARFSQRDCLGTREVLSEEDELQPNGKVFKKVRKTDLTTNSICYTCMIYIFKLKCVFSCFTVTSKRLVMFSMNINVFCGIFQWNGKFIWTQVLLKHSKNWFELYYWDLIPDWEPPH